uniref:Amino acid transporter transmembrane domain-containing protein n=1 Tax=Leersia perrieri TaxID=77586 RepID=A0A0D9WJ94_9ORYZ
MRCTQVETTTTTKRRRQQQHLQVEKKISEEDDEVDDDGRAPKRTGTVVIGSGVLLLAWAIVQLGWVVGPTVMFLFVVVIYFTSNLLADCYRTDDSSAGRRNYTYMDAVKANLGGGKVKLCGFIQYLNLLGVAIGYTIVVSISMMDIQRSNCFHHAAMSNTKNPCHASSNIYMIIFGVVQEDYPKFNQRSAAHASVLFSPVFTADTNESRLLILRLSQCIFFLYNMVLF